MSHEVQNHWILGVPYFQTNQHYYQILSDIVSTLRTYTGSNLFLRDFHGKPEIPHKKQSCFWCEVWTVFLSNRVSRPVDQLLSKNFPRTDEYNSSTISHESKLIYPLTHMWTLITWRSLSSMKIHSLSVSISFLHPIFNSFRMGTHPMFRGFHLSMYSSWYIPHFFKGRSASLRVKPLHRLSVMDSVSGCAGCARSLSISQCSISFLGRGAQSCSLKTWVFFLLLLDGKSCLISINNRNF